MKDTQSYNMIGNGGMPENYKDNGCCDCARSKLQKGLNHGNVRGRYAGCQVYCVCNDTDVVDFFATCNNFTKKEN